MSGFWIPDKDVVELINRLFDAGRAASESKFGCLCARCLEKTIDDGLSIYKNGTYMYELSGVIL